MDRELMKVEKIEIAPGFRISRIIKGGWQLSQGHGSLQGGTPIEDMFAFAEAGITTFDCADIYTGVEELIGEFLKLRKKRMGNADDIKVLTKYVPDYDELPEINKASVERIIDRSLTRLGLERLDMVQFSWWSYEIPGWVETAGWLQELQRAGKINLLSATNFNTTHSSEILDAGVKLSTMQVQYSLLDRRPATSLAQLCKSAQVHMLCYGTLAGGFLSEKWLGQSESKPPYENRSLTKYKLIIDEFGQWELFQTLLKTLKSIAEKHGVSIANVATRYILDKDMVGGVILGARSATHLQAALNTFGFTLDHDDTNKINSVLEQGKGPSGDVFDIERIKDGPHGLIMKYGLNRGKAT